MRADVRPFVRVLQRCDLPASFRGSHSVMQSRAPRMVVHEACPYTRLTNARCPDFGTLPTVSNEFPASTARAADVTRLPGGTSLVWQPFVCPRTGFLLDAGDGHEVTGRQPGQRGQPNTSAQWLWLFSFGGSATGTRRLVPSLPGRKWQMCSVTFWKIIINRSRRDGRARCTACAVQRPGRPPLDTQRA